MAAHPAPRIRSGRLDPPHLHAATVAHVRARLREFAGLFRRLSAHDEKACNAFTGWRAAEVTADDVARGFLHLAMSEASTGAILTVDGGNIAAALR